MKKPVIGITGAYVKHNHHMEGVYVHHDYHKSVAANGGLPIILPFINEELALEMAEMCDGIILSGGEDVDPAFYKQDPHLHLGPTIPERDLVEMAIAKHAIEKNIPLLAICRGIQVLNVALGGTLIQDIPSQTNQPIQHSQIVDRARDTHWVDIEIDSNLYKILGADRVRVNSLHHQSINLLGSDLKVVAVSSDGIIEAVEYTGPSTFTLGVQWNPESMTGTNVTMNKLFSEFLKSSHKVIAL
ncbi:putative glutamine amidotransferase [Bacillus mesophilus]|uniref:Gamma-glutamyl-gamma-aminobutyrate hydrolase family protein n=1 Tax=Bacillus mesophilus TaxID=1808955 RepID=A0A6M0Q8C7_9BACI|nr:gamma-glutamyl-gamma-aminobutyrate hydrolase family protein [Bacillus mesophilus]MBM7662028.1 putative glutamine amidotransferase [Bacillus mesophilus]NEY72616.1 gamma-glutamyl-gamma-aminobutyrate hydrolase family protein [Bacillus mesophilus]